MHLLLSIQHPSRCKVAAAASERSSFDHVTHSERPQVRHVRSSYPSSHTNPHVVRHLRSSLRRHRHLFSDVQDSSQSRPSSKLPKARIAQLVGRRRKHAPPHADHSLLFIGLVSSLLSLYTVCSALHSTVPVTLAPNIGRRHASTFPSPPFPFA